ncbi:MAG: hypothetical protein M1826_005712 [Phylliscum demangeonii]|nr:MAG: hypothetical protein M1826_005712 [Phylliscum demangeonii]
MVTPSTADEITPSTERVSRPYGGSVPLGSARERVDRSTLPTTLVQSPPTVAAAIPNTPPEETWPLLPYAPPPHPDGAAPWASHGVLLGTYRLSPERRPGRAHVVIGGFDRRDRFIRRVHNYDRQGEILPGGQLGRITSVPPAAVDYELRFRGLDEPGMSSVKVVKFRWTTIGRRYQAHINVEICASVQAIKYIHKYIYKEFDRTDPPLLAPAALARPTRMESTYVYCEDKTDVDAPPGELATNQALRQAQDARGAMEQIIDAVEDFAQTRLCRPLPGTHPAPIAAEQAQLRHLTTNDNGMEAVAEKTSKEKAAQVPGRTKWVAQRTMEETADDNEDADHIIMDAQDRQPSSLELHLDQLLEFRDEFLASSGLERQLRHDLCV